jgi:hypothetical protein
MVTNEETVSWSLDFLSVDLNALDKTEQWKLIADACKFLHLSDISQDGKLYIDPPRISIRHLQDKLKASFMALVPFLEGKKEGGQVVIPVSKKWPSRVFVVSRGELISTRILEKEKIEEVGVANFIDTLLALTPLPLERFQKCETCGRWFFPVGRRIREKRRFCSRACNLKSTAKRQRERMKAANNKKGGK